MESLPENLIPDPQYLARAPQPSFPKPEMQLNLQALDPLGNGTCLRHPRVLQADNRALPGLVKPQRKRQHKETHQEELRQYYERLIAGFEQAGWERIFPDGSVERTPHSGMGYGVYFGDPRDMADFDYS